MKKILFALVSLFTIISFASCEKVPAPQITEAQFPFEVVYEIDGETITLSDVYVCEYEGVSWNEGFGRHRQWKGYVKGTGTRELILLEDDSLKFAVNLGTPEYYMSDPSMAYTEEFTPYLYYIRTFESGGVSSGTAGLDELTDRYKIKLISCTLSKPIKNAYR